MATLSDATALAEEINSQARHHPRVSMLLIPQATVENDELVISLYWLDRYKSEARDTVLRFTEYASEPIERAAKRILDKLIEPVGTAPPD